MLPFALQEYCTSSALFNRGNPPHHPSIYNIKEVPHMEVKVPSMEVSMKAERD